MANDILFATVVVTSWIWAAVKTYDAYFEWPASKDKFKLIRDLVPLYFMAVLGAVSKWPF